MGADGAAAPARPRRFRYPGRLPTDDRAALEGILWVLRNDVPWRELPTALFGVSGVTCWRRLRDWNTGGVWQKLHEVLLAETIDGWWPETLGFLETRVTNAGTEGTNRMVKDAARIAFGFHDLDNQRRRVRFHCTRRSRRTTSAEAVKPPQL